MKKIFVKTKDKNSSLTHSMVNPIITIHKLPVLTDFTQQIRLGIQNGALVEIKTDAEVQRIYDDYKTVNPYAKVEEVKVVEEVIVETESKVLSIEEIIESGDYKLLVDKALELGLENITKKSKKSTILEALKSYLVK